MKNSKLFITSLIAAAAMTFSAQAENINLSTTATELGKTTTAGQGNTYTASGTESLDAPTGVISWGTLEQALGLDNIGFAGQLSGTGTVLFGFSEGNGGRTVTINVANNSLDNFSGALTFVNTWNSNTLVKLNGGTGTQNIHYLFGGVSQEKGWSNKRMYGQNNTNMCNDTLELTGNTTLAGITGTSKGYSQGSVSNVNQKEHLNVATTNTVLTLAGGGNYSFYGTVGTATNRVGINKTGTGTQVLGGNLFLGSVTVTDGTLDLSGATVSLSETISNSGTVTVSTNTVFNLNGLTASNNVYTLISGNGTITNGNLLTLENFSSDGVVVNRRSKITNSNGTLSVTLGTVYSDLVWAGAENAVWNTTAENKVWTRTSDTFGTKYDFANGDSVTFSTVGATVTVEGTVDPNKMTVSQATTFAGTGTINVAVASLTMSAKTTIDQNVVLNVGDVTAFKVDFSNLAGTGTFKFNGANTNHSSGVKLGSDFTGTVEISGNANLPRDTELGGATKVVINNAYLWTSETKEYSQEFVFSGQCTNPGNVGDAKQRGNGNITYTGAVTLTEGSSFGFEQGTTTFAGSFTGEAGSTLYLGASGSTTNFSGETTIDTLNISGGTTNFTNTANFSKLTIDSSATVNVGDGGVLTITGTSDSTPEIAGTLNINAGGIAKFAGHDLMGWNSRTNVTAVLMGTTEKKATLYLNDTNANGGLTFTDVIKLNGNALVSSENAGKLNSFGGKFVASGVNNKISDVEIQLRKAFEVEVTGESDELEISSVFKSHSEGGDAGFSKTGLGTLVLSGNNANLSRSVSISEGTLVAANKSALGTGNVSVANGAKLQVNVTGVETQGAIIFASGAKLVLGNALLDGVTVDESITLKIIGGNAISYNGTMITAETVDSFVEYGSAFADYSKTWEYANGNLTLTLSSAVPEPSMFGLLAGLGALALVGARRRRKTK